MKGKSSLKDHMILLHHGSIKYPNRYSIGVSGYCGYGVGIVPAV